MGVPQPRPLRGVPYPAICCCSLVGLNVQETKCLLPAPVPQKPQLMAKGGKAELPSYPTLWVGWF